jgi:hypothetical protein
MRGKPHASARLIFPASLLFVLAVGGFGEPASGQVLGGPQFQVSDLTTGYAYEREPSVAADAEGNFVVVWRAYEYGPPYGPQILVRRFAADGTPGGPQFQVSSITTGYVYESQPSVAADADGDFVVVWRDYQNYSLPYGPQIQARRFDADGTPGGPQFQVSSITTGYAYERNPSVAANADGDFVVVWNDYQYPGPPEGLLIQGRQFQPVVGVGIDIMPSDPGNNLNLRAGKGASISVAVLSISDFDAPNLIDPSTLKFGPAQASISGSPRVRDVDGDGDEDLVVKFLTNETGIACGDTQARLTGRTLDSQLISGSDATNTFNCPRNRKRW